MRFETVNTFVVCKGGFEAMVSRLEVLSGEIELVQFVEDHSRILEVHHSEVVLSYRKECPLVIDVGAIVFAEPFT